MPPVTTAVRDKPAGQKKATFNTTYNDKTGLRMHTGQTSVLASPAVLDWIENRDCEFCFSKVTKKREGQ